MAIRAYVNPAAGSARAAIDALARVGGFELHLVPPQRLQHELRNAVESGAERVLVAGGDGTIETAAAALAGTATALAVLPGGTLNHFARDHGIPRDPDEALRLAASGPVGTVDVGYVNDRAFINTSSLGAYVHFVHVRDRLEPTLGYWLASVIAAFRTLANLRHLPFVLEVGGETLAYEAPLLFVGVGERLLTPAGRGARKPDGIRSLHIVIPRGRRQTRRFTREYARGGQMVDSPPTRGEFGLDSMMADQFRTDVPGRKMTTVAEDGEIRPLPVPLVYRLARDALRVVGVRSGAGASGG